MNCSHCGAALPDGALFCGDCGRSVAAPTAERCAQCDAGLAPTDIFCGECGFVRPSIAARRRASDTVVLDPFPWGAPVEPKRAALPEADPSPVGRELPPPLAEASDPRPPALVAPPPQAASRVELRHDVDVHELDLDETRLVDRSGRGEWFVLQFSTGESVRVSGTGLIGRNPVAEPGEYFDTFVTIVDPGRSVSKTHIEFGQDSGVFWISDRYTGNGTVLREPDRAPRRCDAGKRYRVARGTRVDIGEQFFIVS